MFFNLSLFLNLNSSSFTFSMQRYNIVLILNCHVYKQYFNYTSYKEFHTIVSHANVTLLSLHSLSCFIIVQYSFFHTTKEQHERDENMYINLETTCEMLFKNNIWKHWEHKQKWTIFTFNFMFYCCSILIVSHKSTP